MTDLAFPDGFLWGTATAAHQIEGGNVNNDWWAWEHEKASPCVEPSGDACDSWHRWGRDVDLVADLGLQAYRFSVEWSRVEPWPTEWSLAALDRYRRLAQACRDRGIEPIVTLHHFTSPRWLADRGGWTWPNAPEHLGRFAEQVAAALGDLVTRYITINEPNVVSLIGFRYGIFPPGRQDSAEHDRANEVLLAGHRAARDGIRQARGRDAAVGCSLALQEWGALPGGEDRVAAAQAVWEGPFLEEVAADAGAADGSGDDYLGVQTYTRALVWPPDDQHPADPEPRVDEVLAGRYPQGTRTTQMGWEFRPEAVGAAVRDAYQRTGLPVLVTENGIATTDDTERIEYAHGALTALHAAISDGVPVQGYLHWSLLDNFEWALGYRPTFGLVAVDRETFTRTPKPSAHWLGEVARANALPQTNS